MAGTGSGQLVMSNRERKNVCIGRRTRLVASRSGKCRDKRDSWLVLFKEVEYVLLFSLSDSDTGESLFSRRVFVEQPCLGDKANNFRKISRSCLFVELVSYFSRFIKLYVDE